MRGPRSRSSSRRARRSSASDLASRSESRRVSSLLPARSSRVSDVLSALSVAAAWRTRDAAPDRREATSDESARPSARTASNTASAGVVSARARAPSRYGSSRSSGYPSARSRARIWSGVRPLDPIRWRSCATRSGRVRSNSLASPVEGRCAARGAAERQKTAAVTSDRILLRLIAWPTSVHRMAEGAARKWTRRDSNPGPLLCESSALTS